MPINWGPIAADSPTLTHPLYTKWSSVTLTAIVIDPSDLKQDLAGVIFDNDSCEVVAYLASLIRLAALVSG